MRYVLGFDGGGTKTDCVLMDETGVILARTRSGPSNPSRISLDSAMASLLEAAEKALAAAKVPADEIRGVVGGIAGAGAAGILSVMMQRMKKRFPGSTVSFVTDLSMTLAATNEIPSVAVIAGTGSAVFGRSSPEITARDGGFGPVLGDPGSAYDIGRKAVSLALTRYLARRFFPLGNEVLALFNCNWVQLQDAIRESPDTILPRVFPLVANAANGGDPDAQELLRNSAKELAGLLGNVVGQLGLREQSFFLAKTGGVFGRSRYFDEAFENAALEIAPSVRIGSLPRPVVEFAAQCAVDCLDSLVREDL